MFSSWTCNSLGAFHRKIYDNNFLAVWSYYPRGFLLKLLQSEIMTCWEKGIWQIGFSFIYYKLLRYWHLDQLNEYLCIISSLLSVSLQWEAMEWIWLYLSLASVQNWEAWLLKMAILSCEFHIITVFLIISTNRSWAGRLPLSKHDSSLIWQHCEVSPLHICTKAFCVDIQTRFINLIHLSIILKNSLGHQNLTLSNLDALFTKLPAQIVSSPKCSLWLTHTRHAKSHISHSLTTKLMIYRKLPFPLHIYTFWCFLGSFDIHKKIRPWF